MDGRSTQSEFQRVKCIKNNKIYVFRTTDNPTYYQDNYGLIKCYLVEKNKVDFSREIKIYGRDLITLDDDEHVPKQKGAEQEKRIVHKVLYPLGAKFCDEGIILINKTTQQEETELIDLERVLNTRGLRKRLWLYCLKYAEDYLSLSLPPNAFLIFDFLHVGPYVLKKGQPPELIREWAHQLGEFDLAIPFWLWLFHDYNIIIKSIDTDVIPICFSYIAATTNDRKPKSIHWEYDKKTGGGPKSTVPVRYEKMLINMYTLYQGTLSYTGLTAQQFVLACILSDTDFYNKQLITYRISSEIIFETIRASKTFIMQRIEPEKKQQGSSVPIIATLNQYELDVNEINTIIMRDFIENKDEDLIDGELGLDLFIRTIHTLTLQQQSDKCGVTVLKRKQASIINDNKVIDIWNNNNNNNTLTQASKQQMISLTGTVETFIPEEKTIANNNNNTKAENEIWGRDKIIREFALRKSKKTYPTNENIKKAHKALSFNLDYWLKSWQQYTIHRQFPERCNILFLASSSTNNSTSIHINNSNTIG